MDYLAIRHLHVSCVALSVSLFVLRGGLELARKPWCEWKLLRVAPHVVDTVLLGSALWMVFLSHQYPFVMPWLTAKVIALFAYIGFGKLALSQRTPASRRPAAFVAALLSVGYIIGVALTRSPTWGLV